MTELEYWEECLSDAFHAKGIHVSADELCSIAKYVQRGREGFSYAFYSPPDSDPIKERERELKSVIAKLQADNERITVNARNAVRKVGGYGDDVSVDILPCGRVELSRI